MVLLNIKYMKNLILLATIFVALFSCKDDPDENIVTLSLPSVFDEYNPDSEIVMGSIFGSVYDENKNPIDKALVKYNGKTYSSDKEGRFVINNEAFDSKGTFFTVEADGYFKGSRRIYPQDGSVNYTYVQLLALNDIGTFDSADGGEIVGDDNIRISFSPNSISSATGGLYNGPVTVSAKWLDPTADNIGEIMPGDLIGLNAAVEEVSLVSYGMMAVELFDNNGNNLNLAGDNTASLSFPIPQEILSDAPTEIPLWSFEDSQYGIWAEEGSATLQNEKYVGEVSHFSTWNCDVPLPIVSIQGQLLSANGTPVPNTRITIRSISSRIGFTDDNGFFELKMAQSEQDHILSVSNAGRDCPFKNPINLGTISEDIDLGPIRLQETNSTFTISGSVVDCENNPITNAIIRINTGDSQTEFLIEDDNIFNIAILNCDDATEFSISVIDVDNFEESVRTTLPVSNNIDFATLSACGTTLTEFFTLTVDGETSTTVTDLEAYFENPETAESLEIRVRRLYASQPELYFLFRAEMDSGQVGTYQLEDLSKLQIGVFEPVYNANGIAYCEGTGQGPCRDFISIEWNITENGGVDGFLGGDFNGTAMFVDSFNLPIVNTFPFNGEFRMPIK